MARCEFRRRADRDHDRSPRSRWWRNTSSAIGSSRARIIRHAWRRNGRSARHQVAAPDASRRCRSTRTPDAGAARGQERPWPRPPARPAAPAPPRHHARSINQRNRWLPVAVVGCGRNRTTSARPRAAPETGAGSRRVHASRTASAGRAGSGSPMNLATRKACTGSASAAVGGRGILSVTSVRRPGTAILQRQRGVETTPRTAQVALFTRPAEPVRHRRRAQRALSSSASCPRPARPASQFGGERGEVGRCASSSAAAISNPSAPSARRASMQLVGVDDKILRSTGRNRLRAPGEVLIRALEWKSTSVSTDRQATPPAS